MPEHQGGISRRNFLKGIFFGSVATGAYVAEKKYGFIASLLDRLNGRTTLKQPSEEIISAQNELKQENEAAPGMTSIYMCNEKGESIKVDKQERTQYEAWSLVKVPLALLILKDAQTHPEMYKQLTFQGSYDWQTRLFDHMLSQSDNSALRDLSIWMYNRLPQKEKIDVGKPFTGANWKTISTALAQAMRTQLNLSNETTFDANQESVGLYMTTAADMTKCFQCVANPAYPIHPVHRQQFKNALISQDARTRFESYKVTRADLLKGSVYYHKIGNGVHEADPEDSYSFHDAGLIEFPQGKYLAFCVMNDHKTATPEPTMNTRFIHALDTGYRVLCGAKK